MAAELPIQPFRVAVGLQNAHSVPSKRSIASKVKAGYTKSEERESTLPVWGSLGSCGEVCIGGLPFLLAQLKMPNPLARSVPCIVTPVSVSHCWMRLASFQ